MKNNHKKIPLILLSENIILICLGIAFVSKSVYQMNPINVEVEDMQVRKLTILNMDHENFECNYSSVLISYGPIIISFVNSFIMLIIDNYMYLRQIISSKETEEADIVQEINNESEENQSRNLIKKYYPYAAISGQWGIPLLLILSMYSLDTKEQVVSRNINSMKDSCMTMLDMKNRTCTIISDYLNYTQELRLYELPNYLDVIENSHNNDTGQAVQIQSVLDNVYKIVISYNATNMNNTLRKAKTYDSGCMKICYIDTKILILYIFFLIVITYLIPITISIIILTKIHVMNKQSLKIKVHVNRDFLYNVLFWTPVMFDMMLSLIFCSYSMSGTRTSLLTVTANVYQVVKSFLNAKYLQFNAIKPI